LKHIDPTLGVELPEKNYGGNCLIYDPDVPSDPFHNFWVFFVFSKSGDLVNYSSLLFK
jgi:hypothetical protein